MMLPFANSRKVRWNVAEHLDEIDQVIAEWNPNEFQKDLATLYPEFRVDISRVHVDGVRGWLEPADGGRSGFPKHFGVLQDHWRFSQESRFARRYSSMTSSV